MAVKGNLKKFGLLKLVELLCTEKRKTALTLKHWQKEGIIYFYNGEIIHAHLGDLVGNAAAQQLLSWTEGTFKLIDYHEHPDRTVNMSWNEVVLTPMKHSPTPYKTNGQANSSVNGEINTAQEKALELDLITLLSKLEFLQSQISSIKNKKRRERLLKVLIDMVNQVALCGEKWLDREKEVDTLSRAIDMVGQQNWAVQLVQARENRLESRSVMAVFDNFDTGTKQGQQVPREMLEGMVSLIEAHLFLLIGKFQSSAIADQWRDTCQIFLIDTQRVVATQSLAFFKE